MDYVSTSNWFEDFLVKYKLIPPRMPDSDLVKLWKQAYNTAVAERDTFKRIAESTIQAKT